MAKFLKHTSCPSCGSRDNLGIYDDDSHWCFGCGYWKPASISPLVAEARHGSEALSSHPLPSDCSTHYEPVATSWLSKYHVPIETLIKEGVVWSKQRQQLIFTFPPTSLWQARNFSPHSKSKYYTSGAHDDILPI